MRAAIGPVITSLVIGEGQITIPEVDAAQPNGIVFKSSDGSSRLFVSTRQILQDWADSLWGGAAGARRDADSAITNPALLTWIFWENAAVEKYATVPLVEEAGRSRASVAMLIRRQQDYCPDYSMCMPQSLLVAATRGDRIFVYETPVIQAIAPPRECVDEQLALAKRSRAIVDSAFAPGGDRSRLAASFVISDSADAAFRRCYGERISRDPRFASFIAKAHEIASALPSR